MNTKNFKIKPRQTIAIASLTLALAAPVFAQTLPFSKAGTGQPAPSFPLTIATTNSTPAPGTNAVEKFFNGKIPEALANGKFDLDIRARIEDANESGLASVKKASLAPTVRTRVGFTTAPLYGFQASVQGQNTSVIGSEENYNAAGTDGRGYKPVIADPPVTDLDQAWLGYTYSNLFGYDNLLELKGGRERINLDDQRFVGDVDWRQNIQTFDAATLHLEPIDHLDISYTYVWDVHRVYGNVSGLSTTNRDFSSDSHLINASYSGWEYGRFVGYAYLLSLTNAAGANNSSATYGGYFAGAAPIIDKLSIDYRAEYAYQTDYGKSALRYQANYWNLEAGASYDPLALGGGCEDLGSGLNTSKSGGRASFRTPLATLHSFNGWAEMFLTDPSDGLRDLYGYAQVTLPAQIPLRFVYHKFDSDFGHGDYGQEFDVMATKKFGKHWQALLEYAYYEGANAAPPAIPGPRLNMERIWAQIEFMF